MKKRRFERRSEERPMRRSEERSERRPEGERFVRRSEGDRFERRASPRRSDLRMYPAVCDKCGRRCDVPFKPTASKPVYCSDCFKKDDRGSSDFDKINRKLDMIMEKLGI
ncbi:MAG: CxxC-x17-CxxC domain-containing protein [Candidatus Woesearchaeota archaeon]